MPKASWLLDAAALVGIVAVIALVTVANDAGEGAALAAFAIVGGVVTGTVQRRRRPPA